MKNLYTIKTILYIIGIKYGRKLTIFQICVLISFSFLFINCTTALVYNWPDHAKRYTNIKDLNIIVTLFIIYVDFTISNQEMYHLQQIVDDGLFAYDALKPNDANKISAINSDNIKYINKLIFYFSLSVVLTATIFPMVKTLHYVTIIRGYVEEDNKYEHVMFYSAANTTVRNLPSPLTTYYPAGYATLRVYIFNYLFQALSYLLLLHGTGYCAYIVAYDTTNNVANEIKLLCCCLKDTDEIIRKNKGYENEGVIRTYMTNIIDHHAIIIRKVKMIEKGLRVNTSAFSHALVVQLCMSIYTLVQAEDISLIIENFVTSITVLLNLFMSYNQAQHIIDKSDELKHCMFHSSWIDKPLWYKKSILIMSTTANRQLKVHPYGVYVMNRSTFSKVINLSYSYYNLIKSFKRS